MTKIVALHNQVNTSRIMFYVFILSRHVCNTGQVKKLLIISQRQVSAGIRRVTAITGNDAVSAEYLANTLQQRITELDNQVSIQPTVETAGILTVEVLT